MLQTFFQFYKKHSLILSISSILLIWAIIQINFAIPNSILDDWMSWRQADTQTIAINFLNPNSNILFPQINWGGNGPGYVEAEFQLYTFAISQIMKFTGINTVPGQILSLIFILTTSIFLFLSLNLKLKNQKIALVGLLVFLTANVSVHLSTSIMPDSLSIMFYSMGLYYFLNFLENESKSNLILFVFFTAFSGLVKPLALSLGIIQFLIIFFLHRKFLKSLKSWGAWIIILIIVITYMIFSYNLYLKYGNTFGVIGGDKKFPTLHGLLVPIHYLKLIYMIFVWGLGPIGFFSLFFLLAKKKLSYLELSMLIGNIIAMFVAMRYMVNRGYGPHYYVYFALFGAWISALAYKEITEFQTKNINKRLFSVLFGILLVIIYSLHIYIRNHPLDIHYNKDVNKMGVIIKNLAKSGDIIIVRSIANEKQRSSWGNGINNFQDPRVFYISGLKGWALPRDSKGSGLLEKYKKMGAKYYVEPYKKLIDSKLYKWLMKNGEIDYEDNISIIFRLQH